MEASSPEHASALASSLTTAFLLALQRLTPKERAAYLLHEIFDVSYPEVARTLDLQEPACRQLVSRAWPHRAVEGPPRHPARAAATAARRLRHRNRHRFGRSARRTAVRRRAPVRRRSEEHTSELQSLMRISYAVFCLKKKKRKNTNQHKHIQ